jgi:uncharacterized membrane protein YphA (DoxX/SURF4 family)
VLVARFRPIIGAPAVYWIALLGLCAAHLQGGFNKLTDFNGAIDEMQHFGDDIAWLLERVTFNPFKHIDPFGTILMRSSRS